jgi:hypothetical protein
MSDQLLPDGFGDLERFTSWCITTERERNRKRLRSSIEELRDFYDTMLPRFDIIMKHLNRMPVAELPDPDLRLFYLTLSFNEAAVAVERFGAPYDPELFDPERLLHDENEKTRPRVPVARAV